jgi:transposase InsO family protein
VSCFRFIAAEKANYPISLLCRMLGVSRSGFHAWQRRAPSDRELADAWLVERIREIHAESRQTYGARRIHRALRYRGVRVGRKRVERLMRREQLSGLVPKRYRRTTIRVPGVRIADDLVDRNFVPAAPNRLWCADIKYVRTLAGLALPGGGDGLLQPSDRRLVDAARPRSRARRRRTRDGGHDYIEALTTQSGSAQRSIPDRSDGPARPADGVFFLFIHLFVFDRRQVVVAIRVAALRRALPRDRDPPLDGLERRLLR